ncbi:succinate receptor 1 [Elgaria multicarinata webbii]|uniref:succinate receptor 1 n=1 Tax=Elgaria multicarinata webbii TaxID=159646 RepID=UPI002FCCFED8
MVNPIPQEINENNELLEISKFLEKYYLSTMYALEFIFGIIGNSIVVFGYIFCLKTWKSGNIYLFNLTLSDFAFLCTLPSLVSTYSEGKWSYNITWCRINRFLLHGNLYISILFLTFISIDRYMLVKYPFRNNFLQKKSMAIVFSMAIWVLVLLELAPIFVFTTIAKTNNASHCTDYASSGNARDSLIYSMFLTVAGFLMPLCIMCVFYMKIHAFLKKRNSQLTTAPSFEKPFTLILMAVGIFSLLFTPYHIMRNVRLAFRMERQKFSAETQELINIIYILTRPVAFLNSVINPVFYFLMGDHFREMLISKVRHIFKRFTPCCNEFKHGSQTARRPSEE